MAGFRLQTFEAHHLSGIIKTGFFALPLSPAPFD
jgi:hypothetical protein